MLLYIFYCFCLETNTQTFPLDRNDPRVQKKWRVQLWNHDSSQSVARYSMTVWLDLTPPPPPPHCLHYVYILHYYYIQQKHVMIESPKCAYMYFIWPLFNHKALLSWNLNLIFLIYLLYIYIFFRVLLANGKMSAQLCYRDKLNEEEKCAAELLKYEQSWIIIFRLYEMWN